MKIIKGKNKIRALGIDCAVMMSIMTSWKWFMTYRAILILYRSLFDFSGRFMELDEVFHHV